MAAPSTCFASPLSSLSILSWNVALCAPSAAAPLSWTGGGAGDPHQTDSDNASSSVASSAIRDEILRFRPDVVALQEVPDPHWATSHLGPEYESVGATPSHCGYVELLLNRPVFDNGGATVASAFGIGPSVAALLQLPNRGRPLAVTSSHLAPFKTGEAARMAQLKALVETLPEGADCILAGDMNMRAAEDTPVERTLGLADAWKAAGSNASTKNTWDSVANKFHADGFPFRCRFDRIYVNDRQRRRVKDDSSADGGGEWKVREFSLVGTEPQAGGGAHFLSDHYGMFLRLDAS